MSAPNGDAMLEIESLDVAYGDFQASVRCRHPRRRGRDRVDHRRQRRRQVDPARRRSRDWSPAWSGTITLRRRVARVAARHRAASTAASPSYPRAGASSRRSRSRRTSPSAASPSARARGTRQRGPRRVPAARTLAQAQRRHALGWRAADARDRPRPDVEPRPAVARRGVARPRPCRREAGVQGDPGDQGRKARRC